MKKKIFYIFIFLIIFIYPKNINADTNIEFDCYDEIMIGNKLECKISLLNPNEKIKGIQVNYSYNSVFSYIETKIGNDWTSATTNNKGFAVINLDGLKENSEIAQLNFMVSNNANVQKEYEFKLSNILLSNGEKDISINDKKVNVKILSILDILDSLSVNGEMLVIKDGVTDYTFEIASSDNSATIDAILKSEKYSFEEEYGPKKMQNLTTGNNLMKIKIRTSENELVTININIKRLENNQIPNNNKIIINPQTNDYFSIITIVILFISLPIIIFYSKKIKEEN